MNEYFDQKTVQQFAQNVRTLRQERKLSQEKLALIAGIDRTYVSKIERVKCSVSICIAKRIATALGVGIEKLID
jgi:transcriptional regulator with XRE-family HTH domain